MPKVKFNVNLGSRDASALGLDWSKCTKDSVQEVTQTQADGLSKTGEHVVTVLQDRHAPLPVLAPAEKEPAKGK